LHKSDRFIEEEYGIPKTFDEKFVTELRVEQEKTCMLCERSFGRGFDKEYHCKRCARSVCKDCSASKKVVA
jgi:hypothetical protein